MNHGEKFALLEQKKVDEKFEKEFKKNPLLKNIKMILD